MISFFIVIYGSHDLATNAFSVKESIRRALDPCADQGGATPLRGCSNEDQWRVATLRYLDKTSSRSFSSLYFKHLHLSNLFLVFTFLELQCQSRIRTQDAKLLCGRLIKTLSRHKGLIGLTVGFNYCKEFQNQPNSPPPSWAS